MSQFGAVSHARTQNKLDLTALGGAQQDSDGVTMHLGKCASLLHVAEDDVHHALANQAQQCGVALLHKLEACQVQ